MGNRQRRIVEMLVEDAEREVDKMPESTSKRFLKILLRQALEEKGTKKKGATDA